MCLHSGSTRGGSACRDGPSPSPPAPPASPLSAFSPFSVNTNPSLTPVCDKRDPSLYVQGEVPVFSAAEPLAAPPWAAGPRRAPFSEAGAQRTGGRQEGGDSVRMEPRPVPVPSARASCGAGWDAQPCLVPADQFQLHGGQARHSTVSVSSGGRASARWPPAHRYLSRGAANCPRPLSVLPATSLGSRAEAQPPRRAVPLTGPRGRSAAAGLLPERVAEHIPSSWVGSRLARAVRGSRGAG